MAGKLLEWSPAKMLTKTAVEAGPAVQIPINASPEQAHTIYSVVSEGEAGDILGKGFR
jgi:hypothetical protein